MSLAFGSEAQAELELPDLRVSGVEVDATTTKFDLQLTVAQDDGPDGAGGFRCLFTYATAVFDEATVVELGRRFTAVLEAVVADPQRPVGDIDVLDPALAQQLRGVHGPQTVAPTTLWDVFDAARATAPDAVAVRDETGSLTYAELDVRARRIGAVLRSRGVDPGTPVAVAVGRSVESITAFWGIVASAAPCSPSTPTIPPSASSTW